METATLQKVVQMYVEAFEKADLDIIRKLYAEDATLEDPAGSPARHGIKEIIEFYKAGFAMGMKLKLTGKPRCAGNSVAFGFDGVMKKMTISPIDVFELNADGKIQHMRAYWGPDNVS
ncbi:MAG TPA: nuclear transport factor 2 family protein [Dehalococcoidia bacterium]|jgi:steroid delta-isomerase|nr:nuclear transport factor 2 family protein [Dehalococcoidia bacterium]